MKKNESRWMREAVIQMRALQSVHGSDCEEIHIEADDLLCKVLRRLGAGDLVESWERIEKY